MLRLEFIGPKEYSTFVALNKSGLAQDILMDGSMRKIICGNWNGIAVFVQWNEEDQRGTMIQVNRIDADREIRQRISQNDFSMLDAKGQEA